KPPQGEEPSNLINAGTWLFEPEVLERVPDDESAVRDGFSERVLFPGIIEDGRRVQGFVEDLWVDVGSPDRFLRANQLMLTRVCAELGEDIVVLDGAEIAASAQISGRVHIGRGANIGAGVTIAGPTVIGDETIVGAGAAIASSVSWEEARIGEGAAVQGSIVGAYAGIGDGASVIDAVLANGAEVVEGWQLEPGARIMPNERVGATP